MREERPDQVELEQLLDWLKRVEGQGPSPAVRNRLQSLHAERLRQAEVRDESSRWRVFWLSPIVSFGVVTAVVVAGIWLAPHRWEQRQADTHAVIQSPAATPADVGLAAAAASHSKGAALVAHHALHRVTKAPSPQRMVVQLPYSNSAIATGTSTTVEVSMSQYELASVGFPVSGAKGDSHIVAELTLGDDGLPRSISLPLPLEGIKEKR
jgi:hypothetical protein